MADFDSSIKVMFGGDTTGLKQSIGDANNQILGFAKGAGQGLGRELSGLERYGAVFAAGLGMKELGKAVFDVIDDAQQLRDELERIGDPIDEATRNIATVGDAFDQAKISAEHFGTIVLNAFKDIEDAQRYTTIALVGGSMKEAVAADVAAAQQVETARKLAAEKKRLAEENSPEKIAALTDELAKTQQKNLEDQLSGTSKINALLADQLALQTKLGTLKAGTAAYLKTEIELANKAKDVATESAKADEALAQSRIASIKQESSLDESSNGKVVALLKERSILMNEQVKLNKDSAEYQKLTTTLGQNQVDIANVYREQTKAASLDKADQYQYELLMLKNADSFTVADKAQLDVYQAQSAEKKIQAQLQDKLANGVDNLKAGDKQRIAALEVQDDRAKAIVAAAEAELAAQKAGTDEIEKQNALLQAKFALESKFQQALETEVKTFEDGLEKEKADADPSNADYSSSGGAFATSGNFKSASNNELKEFIQQQRAAAAKNNMVAGSSPSLGTQYANEDAAQRRTIAANAAQKELDFRNSLQSQINMFGVDNARRNYQGDPLNFDSVVSQIQQTNTESSKQTALLTKISNGISTLTDQGNFG